MRKSVSKLRAKQALPPQTSTILQELCQSTSSTGRVCLHALKTSVLSRLRPRMKRQFGFSLSATIGEQSYRVNWFSRPSRNVATLFIYTFEIWICGYLTDSIVNGLFLRANKYNKNIGSHSEARSHFLQEIYTPNRCGKYQCFGTK